MKKLPYLIAILVATLLAIVVWLCVPKEYSAVTKVSDEYKEVDLAIGMNMMKAQIQAAMGGANTGMNDMEVYCKALSTETFAHAVSQIQIPGKDMTYGEYLGCNDTIETMQDHLQYSCSSRQATLTISFSDRDPMVAYQMLDSITAHLQEVITGYRHLMAEAAYQNAKQEADSAKAKYEQAQAAFASFADSHVHVKSPVYAQKQKALEKEATLLYNSYREAANQCARQLSLMKRDYSSFAVVQDNSVPLHDNRHFLVYLGAFATLLLLLTRALILFREQHGHIWPEDFGDFFSPWSLTIFIWVADIILYFLQGTMDPIGPKFITGVSIWLITLLPTSLLAYGLTRRHEPQQRDYYKAPIEVPRMLFNVLCVVAGVLTLAYATRIWGIVSRFDMENLLYNLRLYIVEDNSVTGLLNHVQGLNFALFLVGIWMFPKISKWQMTYIVVVNLVFELFRMEKSGILIMILGTMFMLYQREKIKIRSILVTMAGIIVLFFFFNLSKEEADTTTETTFLDFFGMYITSPMVAFEHLYPDLTGNFGENTFCILYPYFNMLGFDLQYMERLQEFVWVPIPTNVYTVMQPFYNDFGFVGIGFFGILYGTFFGWTYRRFREGNPVFICIYTYLIEVILIQFYNDNLLQNIVLFIEFWLCVFILTQKRFTFALSSHESYHRE